MCINAEAPVVFIDSGVGGLPYCGRFAVRNPDAAFCYVADREHFPYGGRSKSELIALLEALVRRIVEKAAPRIVVMACNTASVSALAELRARFPALTFVGTVPAVRPAVLGSAGGVIGVLGTERTIEDEYIAALTSQTKRRCAVIRRAAPELVAFVEEHALDADARERRAAAARWIDEFRALGADGVVLGCTHFLFLLDEFRAAAAPDITIYESVEGVCRRIESLRAGGCPAAARKQSGTHSALPFLFVTGTAPLEERWGRWAERWGLKAALFEEAR